MVQEAKKKTVHMEGTWRLELTSVGLHPCEASIQEQCEDVQTLPGADIDSDHDLLVAKVLTRLKKIVKFQKSRPRWDLEKLYAQRQSAGYSRRETRCI